MGAADPKLEEETKKAEGGQGDRPPLSFFPPYNQPRADYGLAAGFFFTTAFLTGAFFISPSLPPIKVMESAALKGY
jgi:hypothetical protein